MGFGCVCAFADQDKNGNACFQNTSLKPLVTPLFRGNEVPPPVLDTHTRSAHGDRSLNIQTQMYIYSLYYLSLSVKPTDLSFHKGTPKRNFPEMNWVF